MKITTIITGTLLTFSTLSISSVANATPVNYDGSTFSPQGYINMNTVSVNQTGTISNIYYPLFSLPPNVVGTGTVYGNLPSMSKITFSYSFTGLSQGELRSTGGYGYTEGGNAYAGNTLTDTHPVVNSVSATFNGIPSLPLVWSTANLNVVNPGTSTGTTTIQNNNSTGHNVSFASLFSGILQAIPAGVGTITYKVSAIPLPASLPLFGALVAGMFGFVRLSNKRKHATLAA